MVKSKQTVGKQTHIKVEIKDRDFMRKEFKDALLEKHPELKGMTTSDRFLFKKMCDNII